MRESNLPPDSLGAVTLRTDLRPGHIGSVVRLLGVVYARECGFDPTFEAYVAGPLVAVGRALPAPRSLSVAI